MKIYIARHGETDANTTKKLMGQRLDEGLNEKGIHQADELAESLKDATFDLVFSSPLKRAYETAMAVSKKIGVPIITDPRLSERDFGDFTGKTWKEMSEAIATDTNFKNIDLELTYDYRPYGGECVDDVKKRFLSFVDALKEHYFDKKVLIVAHGGIIKLAHSIFNEKTIDTPDNSSLHEFEI
ncbi:MAG: histidine phosphatase family protein [Candidatus Paceibacterota bacterium]|jgi:probable phosphoglycerate mutase